MGMRYAVFVLTACFVQGSLLFSQDLQEAPEPVANAAAVVVAGHVRFTVMTPQLIRLESAPDSKFVDDPSFIFLNRDLPVPAFQKKVTGREVTIDTAALHLVYRRDGSPRGFTPENLAITLQVDGKPVT